MWHFLFGLRGRIGRASFCLFAAIAFVVFLVLMAALYAYTIMAGDYERGGPVPWPSSPAGIAGVVLWFGVLIVLAASGIAVSVKRLHDRGERSWRLLLFILVPSALSSAAQMWRDSNPLAADELAAVLNLVAVGIYAWAFVELACLKGTTGENRFGPDPLARRA